MTPYEQGFIDGALATLERIEHLKNKQHALPHVSNPGTDSNSNSSVPGGHCATYFMRRPKVLLAVGSDTKQAL